MNISDLFTLVKAMGNGEFYLLLPGKVDIDTEDGKEIVVKAAKNKYGTPYHNPRIIKFRYASIDEVKISDLSLGEYLLYLNALKEANIL